MRQAHGDGETIAAISTPPGPGGIGVIRMSGTRSLPILRKIFQPHNPPCAFRSHLLYYGRIRHPSDGGILDEVLVVYMQSPRTYTREDVVEIHCHSSFPTLRNILEAILSLGVSLAGPGEFTKRAFLNGRIDLTRAEAVIDILAARTRKGVDLAQKQLAGALYQRVDSIRRALITMRATLEVAIDFPDEDVEIVRYGELLEALRSEVEKPLAALVRSADQGKLYREGISAVIVGLPNVGKSSLLNALLQEERALVTSIPGTTRDTIEEYMDIFGMPVRIVDTAGMREDADEVEALGIRRARERIAQADLVLFMLDGARELSREDEDIFITVASKPLVVVINKTDLLHENGEAPCSPDPQRPEVRISAKNRTGIEELKRAIFHCVTGGGRPVGGRCLCAQYSTQGRSCSGCRRLQPSARGAEKRSYRRSSGD